MSLRSAEGCLAVCLGVACLVPACGDGGKTVYIINTGGAAGIGGSETGGTGAGAQGSGGSTAGSGGAGGPQGGSSSTSGGVSNGGSGGSGDAGSATAGSAGTTAGSGGVTGDCNSLAQGPEVFEAEATGSTPPVMSGGVIVDGTYQYTQRVDYDGSCDCSHNQVFVISAGGSQFEENYDGTRRSGTLAVSGTTLNFNYTCPTAGVISVLYTASASELRLWTVDDNRLDVFLRQ